jgi:hypothetical protein
VLDLYPGDIHCSVPLNIVPEVEHRGFPGIPVYDTSRIPGSHWNDVDIPSGSIVTYPMRTHPHDDHQIPDDAPYHFKQIYFRPYQLISPLTTPAQQFNLQIAEETNSSSKQSIVVRRGCRVKALERTWVLVMVSCGNRKAHLLYESRDGSVPVTMMITHDIPRCPEIMGRYYLIENR